MYRFACVNVCALTGDLGSWTKCVGVKDVISWAGGVVALVVACRILVPLRPLYSCGRLILGVAS